MTDQEKELADINRTATGMELSLKRACIDGPIISLGKYIDDLKSAVEVVNKMKAIIDRLTAKIPALREDKARLDWLDEECAQCEENPDSVFECRRELIGCGGTIRAAIDEARGIK